MDHRDDRDVREFATVVVGRDRRIAPGGDLVGEDLRQCLTRKTKVSNEFARNTDLIGERRTTCNDGQIGERATRRSHRKAVLKVLNVLTRGVCITRQLVLTLVTDVGNGEVSCDVCEVLTTLSRPGRREDHLEAVLRNVCNPLVNRIG